MRWLPHILVGFAVTLAVGLAVGVAALGVRGPGEEPVRPLALPTVPAPDAGSASCRELVDALPASIRSDSRELRRRDLADPAPEGAVGWGAPDAVVLRCGLSRPGELTATSRLTVVDGVRWFHLADAGSSTWVVVDRDVHLAVTLPPGAGTGPVQDVSAVVSRVLPARPGG